MHPVSRAGGYPGECASRAMAHTARGSRGGWYAAHAISPLLSCETISHVGCAAMGRRGRAPVPACHVGRGAGCAESSLNRSVVEKRRPQDLGSVRRREAANMLWHRAKHREHGTLGMV
ncbi:hypothetical protein AB1Y20_003673 [Prymnesium parvum]|uniref:Uncharacterized protein n=1 Tax=Prymnesium parvum TaxID=97485 RepID=A0AB34J590_PRYPA